MLKNINTRLLKPYVQHVHDDVRGFGAYVFTPEGKAKGDIILLTGQRDNVNTTPATLGMAEYLHQQGCRCFIIDLAIIINQPKCPYGLC